MKRLALAALVPFLGLQAPAAAQFGHSTLQRFPASSLVAPAIVKESSRIEIDGDSVFLSVYEPVGGSTATERAIAVIDTGGGTPSLERLISRNDLALPPSATVIRIAETWSVSDGVLALRASYLDPSLSSEYTAVVAIFEDGPAGWTLTQHIRPDASGLVYRQSWGAPKLSGNRLVLISGGHLCGSTIPNAQIATYERAGPGSPFAQVARQPLPCTGSPVEQTLAQLDGDWLAVPRPIEFHDVPVDIYGWTGDDWTLRGSADPRSLSVWSSSPHSIALRNGRLAIGTYYDGWTTVFELDSTGAPIPMERLSAYRLAGRDFNPPYEASVALGAGFMAIGIGVSFDGYATTALLEDADGAFRPFELQRNAQGVVRTALDGSRLVTLQSNPPMWPAQLTFDVEIQDLDRARHLPYCRTDARLLMSGSGAAPLDAAAFRAYDVPAGSLAQVFGAFAVQAAPAGGLGLCLGSAFARIGAPVAVDSTGRFTVPTASLSFGTVAPALFPGGTAAFQVAFRAPGGGLDTTNALRVQLAP